MGRSPREWQGTLAIEPGRVVYVGPAGEAQAHRHHALQLAVGLERPIGVSVADTEPQECWAIVIATDVVHAIDGGGGFVGLYYVDGSSHEGSVLAEVLGTSGWLVLPDRVAATLRETFSRITDEGDAPNVELLRRGVAEALGVSGNLDRSPPEGVVYDAIALLTELVPGEIRAADIARRVGVRQRDLSAAFLDETGLSIRSYVLWLRLQCAVAALADGCNLTEAAHASGFADAAHLSRVFRKMFGLAPSVGVGRSRILKGQR